MDAASLISGTGASAPSAVTQRSGFADLGSDDFFKLLVTQLTSQDPLAPTDNAELLKQIASIRDIEVNTTLSESLRALTGQQNIGSASGLLGQHITSMPDGNGLVQTGIVAGVRFDASGPVLILSSGVEVPLTNVAVVQPPGRAAEALIGQSITGLDRRDPKNSKPVEGLVTAVKQDGNGEWLLELDTGDDVRFRDVLSATAA